MKMRFPLLVSLAVALPGPTSFATTTSGSLPVSATVTSSCLVTDNGNLSFGNVGVSTSDTASTATLKVKCTSTTSYSIGLSAGVGSGATTSARKMSTTGGSTLTYGIYQNSEHSTYWGNSSTDSWKTPLTGNGAEQSYDLYGLIPVQTMPAAGSYTDTVTITITYD